MRWNPFQGLARRPRRPRPLRRAQLALLELESRLARTEIEIATARFEEAKRDLEALEREAVKGGYKYIADRAAAARKQIPARTAA